jgi:hypothetical protein
MARVWFEGLPDYASLGGSIAGTLGLETDGVVRATDLLLFLHGTELSQITVQAGKSRVAVIEKNSFLELAASFHDALPFKDVDHVGPGTYRFPFRFDIPATAEPSLATTERPRTRGRFTSQVDGMYVEYELEARLQVPWWVDPIDREVVPVYSPRRVLGALPPFSSGTDPDRPTISLRIDQPMVLPGSVLTGAYTIANPRLKELKQLNLTLLRYVEHRSRDHSAVSEGPLFETDIPLGNRLPQLGGTFQIPIPNTDGTTGPFTGQLYRTYWILRAVIDVSLGFAVKVDAIFAPA